MQVQVSTHVGGQVCRMVLGNSGSWTNSSKVTEEALKGMINELGSDYFEEDKYNINDGFPVLKWENEKIK